MQILTIRHVETQNLQEPKKRGRGPIVKHGLDLTLRGDTIKNKAAKVAPSHYLSRAANSIAN